VRNHLTAAVKADRRAVEFPIIGFELLAVAAARPVAALNPAAESGARHAGAPVDLDVISPGKVEFLVVQPPRHVDVHAAYTVVIVRNGVLEGRNMAGDAGAGRVSEILADDATRIRQSIRKLRRPRVEQETRGFH